MTKARPDKQTYALSLTEQQSLAGLVAAIEAEFNTHLFDELPPEQNFRKSMMRRALQIVRQNLGRTEAPERRLAAITGYNSAELAAALRNRNTGLTDSVVLRDQLRVYVKDKLASANPAFLAQQQMEQK